MNKRKILFIMLALVLSFSLIPMDYNVYADRNSTSTEENMDMLAVQSGKETTGKVTAEYEKETSENDSLDTAGKIMNEKKESDLTDKSLGSKEAISESSDDSKSQTESDESLSSDDKKPKPPIGGGSSGGGGGSSGGGGARSFAMGYYSRPRFNIMKVSKDKQIPMKVAFLITNLKTNESHIAITDNKGRINSLVLAETFDLFIPLQGGSLNPRSDYYLDEKKKEPDLYGRPDGAPPAYEDPLNRNLHPSDPTDTEKAKMNKNDKFKDKINTNDPLKFEDFYKDDRVFFEKKHHTDKLTLTLNIQLLRIGDGDKKEHLENYDITYNNVDCTKFDKYTFIKEVEDFISGKAELKNKSIADYNKRINSCRYTIKLVDSDRPKYKVEELRTDTNLNHNLKTFYLQPGDLNTENRRPSDINQDVWIGDEEDQLTSKLKSRADQEKEDFIKKMDPIVNRLKEIHKEIHGLEDKQKKDYFVRPKDPVSSSIYENTRYTITVKKLIDAKRTDARSLINEFGDLFEPYYRHYHRINLKLKTSDYDFKKTFDNLMDAQKYLDSLKFSRYGPDRIYPGNRDISYFTIDNLLIRVYPEIKSEVCEITKDDGRIPQDPPKLIKTFDNAFDAYNYMDVLNNLPDSYYSLMLESYRLDKEKNAMFGGYELDPSSPPEGLEKALDEYDKKREEILYKQRGYYIKENINDIRKPDYTGPITLLIYEKTPGLMNLKPEVGIGSSESEFDDWLLSQSNMKEIFDKANLGLTPTEKKFQNKDELKKWFEENDMAKLNYRLRTADANVRRILINASPINPILRTRVENEKFEIHTVATDETGTSKTVEKSTNTVIKDKITYKNLNIGSTYKFVGKLVHKKSGKTVNTLNSFEHVLKSITSKDGDVVIKVSFDSSKFQGGDEFVLLYKIYEKGKNDKKYKLVGKEDDINNLDQTVSLLEKPKTRDISVKKQWNLNGVKKPVDKIEVELYRDGKPTGKKLELNISNNWSGKFENLEISSKETPTVEYKYTIKEVGEQKGLIKFGNKVFEVNYSGNMNDGFIISNNEKPGKPPETPPGEPPKTPKEPPVPPEEPPMTPKKSPQTGSSANGDLVALLVFSIGGLYLTRRRKQSYSK